MGFKIPFTRSNIHKLRKRTEGLTKFFRHNPDSNLQKNLNSINSGISREEYLAICARSVFISVIFSFAIITFLLSFVRGKLTILIPLIASIAIGAFVFISQTSYPKMYNSRISKEIERNLIPALQDMLVQLSSGIPLFSIMINLSAANYGALSAEFKEAVKKINAGYPQIDVLEEIGEKSSSPYFKKYLWQLSNGLRAGADISIVIRSSIKSLNEEQLIQIQNYGNKLNPLIMFYMLISVILPALAITFLTILSSMINLSSSTTKFIYFGLIGGVVFIQVMFLGIIKSIRPSLL